MNNHEEVKKIARKIGGNKHCCLNCKWHGDCFREECLHSEEIMDGNHVCNLFEPKPEICTGKDESLLLSDEKIDKIRVEWWGDTTGNVDRLYSDLIRLTEQAVLAKAIPIIEARMNKKGTESRTYESLARRYIEGPTGLFSFYHHELATPAFSPPEVEGAVWVLKCLTNPANRADLDALVRQSDYRARKGEVKQIHKLHCAKERG